MQSDRFRQLLDTPGPFASIYFEDSHDTHDAADQLELKWRGLREQLEQQGVADSVTADIEQAVLELRPPIGRSGRAVIAGATGVVVNEHLLRPTSTPVVRVSELPYIVPIVEHGFDPPNYVLVEVDHTGADITVRSHGTLRSETVDGGGYPVHKAAGAETAGYGDPQLRTDEAARKNVRAVADRVTELVDETGIDAFFVVGEVRSRSDLLAALPERVLGRAVPLKVGARHSGYGLDEVQGAIESWFVRRRLRAIDDAAERFGAEIGRRSGRRGGSGRRLFGVAAGGGRHAHRRRHRRRHGGRRRDTEQLRPQRGRAFRAGGRAGQDAARRRGVAAAGDLGRGLAGTHRRAVGSHRRGCRGASVCADAALNGGVRVTWIHDIVRSRRRKRSARSSSVAELVVCRSTSSSVSIRCNRCWTVLVWTWRCWAAARMLRSRSR